jgi:UDP-2,3-diacylglucosamine hydrolase
MPKPLSAVFVADCHLDERPETLEPFLALLRALPEKAESLYLLGDLFNLWMALPWLESACHRRVLGALAEARAAGMETHFVEGNRDFFGARRRDLAGRVFDSYTEDAMVCERAGRRMLLYHGDRVNRHDRSYLRWRAFAKSGFAFALAHLLPPWPGRFFIHAVEHRMRRSNENYKMGIVPIVECQRYAESKFENDFDTVLLGHFHQERRVKLDKGELIVMPMWGDTRRFLALHRDGRLEFETFAF